ncbi:L-aspartate oxidase [Lichenicola cladoniae]|uniref:L-aspartate oxidase n=1 Tax=Lichenicola cladoniae TaxID=1484109 RepID=A0A6M8HNV0_9PROT|nr:L-aspartate oxidase [Lichenicola cladoniae]NPD67495.1 L-aspartate oxidase [Acetobacteraceae bacterium]QKE89980.1 L-aspartate oxidase [Lichenicola cladoniae]
MSTIIIGSGLAGLLTALEMAPLPCVLVTRAPLGAEAASGWAQGGIAAAIGDDDSPALQLADTLAAGDGLCDAAVAEAITGAGPQVIDTLSRLGVRFDRASDDTLALGLEAAHSRRRIVHAQGDATGAEIVRALVEAVRATPSIAVFPNALLRRVLTEDGRVSGVVIERNGDEVALSATRVVLATGGAGGLFRDTTNPLGATGTGLAAAARAGARLGDLEFIQFHPTALSLVVPSGDASAKLPPGNTPMPLVSEAVRGEGATLIDETGQRFMDNELAPRDVVSRAVWKHLSDGHQVFLDARPTLGERFAARFPGITAVCRARGIDPVTAPIPVRPAAHYHMGGILVDACGRSSVPGLYACGEVACTGLHGANRLASNSLLEAAACAIRIAAAISTEIAETGPDAPMTMVPAASADTGRTASVPLVREIMTRAAGVLRNAADLEHAIVQLAPMAGDDDAALVGLMICVSALERRESRGGHFRTDFLARDALGVRTAMTMSEAMAFADRFAGEQRRAS